MTRRPDPHRDEQLLLESLQGELDAGAAAALQARLAAEPELAAAHGAWTRLLAAEQDTFESAAQTEAAVADAPRLAAWVRRTVAAEETAATRRRFAPARQRGWARVLAWSVGLHVVVLGVLALVLGGGGERAGGGAATSVALEDEYSEPEAFDPAETDLAQRWEHIRWDELGTVGDRLALGEAESLRDELRPDLESLPDDQPRAWDGLNHPVGVVVAMSRRTNSDLKRRRLDLLGFNASGTLKAVDRGLRYLRRQQRPDGSFAASPTRSAVRQTAMTLLAFLADGHTSRGRTERDQVVARGLHWLRQQVRGKSATADSADLGVATVALCEDYMLSFGDLPPLAGKRRADEIAGLAAKARGRLAGSKGADRTWNVWALDAATRAGVVTASDADQRAFRAWVASASADAGEPADTMQALTAGTALLFAERGTHKPRFLTWSRANAERLAAQLDPTGRARKGDNIGDTALILLALQVGYRTY